MSFEPREEGPARGSTELGARFRDVAATLITFCGGLAVLFLFFAAIGAIDLGDAVGLLVAAIVLAAIYLLGAWQRARSGARLATRPDRERRGF